eukprot:321749-Rhodomonas_salina.3
MRCPALRYAVLLSGSSAEDSPQSDQIMHVRKSGDAISIYVNGALVASGTIASASIVYAGAFREDLLIGLPGSQGDSQVRNATRAECNVCPGLTARVMAVSGAVCNARLPRTHGRDPVLGRRAERQRGWGDVHLPE